MSERIIECRSLCIEPEYVIDYSDFERRIKVIEERGKELELRYNHNHDEKGRFCSGVGGGRAPAKNAIDKSQKSDIIKSEEVKRMTISSIDTPIEQKHTGKGNPNAINTFGVELNNRQKLLLEQLPDVDSRVIVSKDSVNMADLSALTAETGHEFAMFTRKNERLVVRGNEKMVDIGIEEAEQLAKNGYKWSGHTHPGIDSNCLIASAGDMSILECFDQKTSVIYNSKGNFRTFEKE